MFIRVEPENLVIGTKYKITVVPYEVEFDRYSGVFKELTRCPAFTTLEFEHPYDLITEEWCSVDTVFLVSNCYHYYAFSSHQPQWQMERRSVNMVLRRLIGDEYFEW